MDFNEAMSQRCSACERRAGWHRLTEKGTLYCLKLNGAGVKRRNAMIYNGYNYDHATLHNIKVKYLERSPLPTDVVEVIRTGMDTYMEVNDGKRI